MAEGSDLTALLARAQEGDEDALRQVMDAVYDDLRRVAGRQLRDRHGAAAQDLTLQPTALVHEAFFRLVEQRSKFENRAQFFAIATRIMLRALLDYYKARSAQKRGGGQVRVTLSGIGIAAEDPSIEIPAFAEALDKLEAMDASTADVVKLRVIWGLTLPEIATTLELSQRTVEREWQFARRWLASELRVAST